MTIRLIVEWVNLSERRRERQYSEPIVLRDSRDSLREEIMVMRFAGKLKEWDKVVGYIPEEIR